MTTPAPTISAPAAPNLAMATRQALPDWTPAWLHGVATTAAAGASSVFVLHGNTYDLMPLGGGDEAPYGTLANLLAEQLFGRYELVLHYDLARGLRPFAGSDGERLRAMFALMEDKRLGLDAVRNEPAVVLAAVDQLIRKTIMAEGQRMRLALLIDQASFLFPAGLPGQFNTASGGMLVTLINWAQSPHLKPLDVSIVLIDEKRSDLSERLVGNPHVTVTEVPLPTAAERERFLTSSVAGAELKSFSDYTVPELAAQTAGLSLVNVRSLIAPARRGGDRLTSATFRALKKHLIEQQCQGLVELVEPRWTLDTVIGFDAAKRRFREDAALLRSGALDCLPMGYLICGPVGTGKSFLVQCAAGEIGIPSVVLKNFRSKYVGETEGNLERVLAVLRAMGPIMVVIDEADAALGDRDEGGDSGTSSRVFAMIATQMGDTRYRGKILWTLLTARPDLLPVDIKRQGRAEVHIPLFYPTDQAELTAMFVAMARKLGTTLDPVAVPPLPVDGRLSGSDVEGMVSRAYRKSRLAGSAQVTADALAEVVADFMPSTQGLERELQECAALLECTDRDFLPSWAQHRIEGGRAEVQARMAEIGALLGR